MTISSSCLISAWNSNFCGAALAMVVLRGAGQFSGGPEKSSGGTSGRDHGLAAGRRSTLKSSPLVR